MSTLGRHSAGARPASTRAARRPYAPVQVVDIDLAEPYVFRPPGSRRPVRPTPPLLALVRSHGHPLGTVAAHTPAATGGTAAPGDLWDALAGEARRRFTGALARLPAAGRTTEPAPPHPLITVVVATHDRTRLLRACLNCLLRTEYPRFEIVVVDNAPADDTTREAVLHEYGHTVRYLREPVAGLARAHNRGLAAAEGDLVAFTDDDTLPDPRWLSALAAAFGRDHRIGCVTGLILPAELETAAQAALEDHGDFGKGYTPRTWSLRHPPDDPLFPFTAGRFGSGTNMAFRTGTLRALGGFDPATGTGTPAHGGDDLLAFFRVLAGGHTLAYQPDAVVWHRHRRTADALPAQAFGYGAGFGAFLTAALLHAPRTAPALLRRLPGGIRHAAARAHDRRRSHTEQSRRVARLELQGLLYGPVGYARSRLRPAARDHAAGGGGGDGGRDGAPG